MTGIVKQFVAERWRWGVLRKGLKPDEVVDELNGRLGKLSETLERLHDRIENGPLPGAYLTVPLYCDTPDIEDQIAATYWPRSYLGARLIGVSASISGQSDASADIDIEVEYMSAMTGSWLSMLTNTPITVTAGGPQQLNAAGDFTEAYFPATGFRVNCTAMTNIPKGLMVLLSLKNVGKIEPVTS